MGLLSHGGESNQETPFSLTYGMKAIIPLEMNIPIIRVASYDPCTNEEAQVVSIDFIEELRDHAYIKNTAYRQSTIYEVSQ